MKDPHPHRFYMWKKDTDLLYPYSVVTKSVLLDIPPFVGELPKGKEVIGYFWFDKGLKYHFEKDIS